MCEVDPRRGIGLSTSPFPWVASRTRCASRPGTGLSASPVGVCRDGFISGQPWGGNRGSSVAIARGAHRVRVIQGDFRGGWPPCAVAVASADGFHGDPAVFAPCPSDDPAQGVVGQVGEGGGGHAGAKVNAPAPQRRVELADEGLERLVDVAPANCLDLDRDRFDGFAGRVGVDVVPVGAFLAVALDAPRKSRPWSMWVIFVFSVDRRRPIAARTTAARSRMCSACSRVPETISNQSSA
jgi:hypothetical protein